MAGNLYLDNSHGSQSVNVLIGVVVNDYWGLSGLGRRPSRSPRLVPSPDKRGGSVFGKASLHQRKPNLNIGAVAMQNETRPVIEQG
jgi:hypothetical protein